MQTTYTRGNTYFELSNHLGNVLAVVTDRKLAQPDGSGGVDFYRPDIVSASDYYPFGFEMNERGFSSPNYRYGFNGMEKDDEMKGNGNSYSTMFRQYDPRIGRWLSVDPVVHYSKSTYCTFDNNPIYYIDPSGQDSDPSTTEANTGGNDVKDIDPDNFDKLLENFASFSTDKDVQWELQDPLVDGMLYYSYSLGDMHYTNSSSATFIDLDAPNINNKQTEFTTEVTLGKSSSNSTTVTSITVTKTTLSVNIVNDQITYTKVTRSTTFTLDTDKDGTTKIADISQKTTTTSASGILLPIETNSNVRSCPNVGNLRQVIFTNTEPDIISDEYTGVSSIAAGKVLGAIDYNAQKVEKDKRKKDEAFKLSMKLLKLAIKKHNYR
jgi:RHS repeat-associated protein